MKKKGLAYYLSLIILMSIINGKSLAICAEQKANLSAVFKGMSGQVIKQMKEYSVRLGTKPWNFTTALKDLPCQVGSLTKLIMQLEGERYRHGKNNDKIKEEIADELADILSLVIFIAHELNIDLDKAWEGMLESDEKKLLTRSSR